VSIGYSSLTFFGPCPHCGSPLFVLSDMWGPFYACEECGYEFSPLVVTPNRAQPQSQPAFAGSFSPGDTVPGVSHAPERELVPFPSDYRTVPALGT
jgi:hypothetical protein